MPYSSKLSRIKLFAQKLYEFTIYINKINQYIFELDINGSILKNKFFRSKDAFNNLYAQIKENNIKLSNKHNEAIEKINNQISSATIKILEPKISSLNSEYIDNIINKIIGTYKLISGTVQISMIIRNLINQLSINRAVNKDLNYQLGIAEREYLEGKYASSLNAIIQYLEGEA